MWSIKNSFPKLGRSRMYLERDSLLEQTHWSYSDALPWIGADSADPPNPYNPTLTAQLCESPLSPPPGRLGSFHFSSTGGLISNVVVGRQPGRGSLRISARHIRCRHSDRHH